MGCLQVARREERGALERRTDAKSPSTCNQSCTSIQIIYRHTILAVKEAEAHIEADKAVQMLQLTIRSQNPSTFSYAKGGFACTWRSCTKSTLVLVHMEQGNKGEGLHPLIAKSQKRGYACPRPHGAREQAKRDFVCPERSHTEMRDGA